MFRVWRDASVSGLIGYPCLLRRFSRDLRWIGGRGDELGDEVVLGRNVLNRLRLLLDGPVALTRLLGPVEES